MFQSDLFWGSLFIASRNLSQTQGMRQLKLSPEAFFRPNLFLVEEVIRQLMEMAQVTSEDVLWDAGTKNQQSVVFFRCKKHIVFSIVLRCLIRVTEKHCGIVSFNHLTVQFESTKSPQDTFCGQGLLSLAFRHHHPFLPVVCIDRSKPALAQLQLNLEHLAMYSDDSAPVEVIQGDLGVPAFLHRLTSSAFGNWTVDMEVEGERWVEWLVKVFSSQTRTAGSMQCSRCFEKSVFEGKRWWPRNGMMCGWSKPFRFVSAQWGEAEVADEEDSDEEVDSTVSAYPFVEPIPASLPAPRILDEFGFSWFLLKGAEAPTCSDSVWKNRGILLADPGRNGMPKAFRRQLLELKVPKLLYCSSGRSFLRDVAYLTKRGYRLLDSGHQISIGNATWNNNVWITLGPLGRQKFRQDQLTPDVHSCPTSARHENS